MDYTEEITEIDSIGVGETVTVYAKYTVSQKDIDTQTTISNIAIATIPGEGEEESTPEESNEVETTPEVPAPGIDVIKTATAVKKNGEESFSSTISRVRPGDVIEYTITVDNIGNITLTDIVVTDSLNVTVNAEEKLVDEETGVATIATIDSLAPNDEPVSIKAYYTVTDDDSANLEEIHNVATATATDGTTDEDEETVLVNVDTSVTVDIIWEDNNDQDGKRPEEVTINIYADGEYIKSETISETTYTFEKLPTYNENGEEIVYTVTEDTIEEYTTTYSEDTFTITNTHIPETINIPVTKVWEDRDNYYGARTAIEVTLNANETVSQTVTITEDDNWEYTFENLPKYEEGEEIDYTVTEKAVDGYQTAITGDKETGFTITNKYNNITINKMTLTSPEIEESKVNLDVVFVLDISASMLDDISSEDDTSRAEAMVNVTNNAITEIMKNPNNRVGIAMFNNEASVVLPLNTYTPKTTSNDIGQYLEFEMNSNNYYINTNVNEVEEASKEVIEGTYTQAGIAVGADMLANAENSENRKPVLIVLSDGIPTYSSTEYTNVPTSDGSHNVGNGLEENSDGSQGYLTILTANYYKNKIAEHYTDNETLTYTIGIGLSGQYAETIFNPTAENIAELNTLGGAASKDLYRYLSGTTTTIRPNGSIFPVRVPSPYDDYSYANGSYMGDMDQAELERILNEIISNITDYYETTTDHESNIETDTSRVELENIDINKEITIILDDASQEYTVQDLISSATVIVENEKYYLDLKSAMFENIGTIEITYYDITN